MDYTFWIATQWIFLALVASLLSIRLGISVALVEIFVGVFGGNVMHLQVTDWVNFLASLGSVILLTISSTV